MSHQREKRDGSQIELEDTTQIAERVLSKPIVTKAQPRAKQRGTPGKKRVTFVDQELGKKLAQVHIVESFKKYNVLDDKESNASCSCRLL